MTTLTRCLRHMWAGVVISRSATPIGMQPMVCPDTGSRSLRSGAVSNGPGMVWTADEPRRE